MLCRVALQKPDGLLAGQGADDVGSFVIRGQAQFATGLATFSKSYERRTAVVWTYRGKLNSNGLAGTWGDVRWYLTPHSS